MTEILLTCQSLTKRFGKKEALSGVDLQLEAGRIAGLLGPNGSGKSTLLKLANGLLSPDGGEILIGGERPGVRSKSMIAYLPDQMYVADWMKVKDLLAVKLLLYAFGTGYILKHRLNLE